MATTRTISQFAEGIPPKTTDKIVYVCGAFDLFHVGHLSFLEQAAKLGDYLIVGIFSDQVMSFLSLWIHSPVNEVIIGVPCCVSDDIIEQFNISNSILRLGIYREVDSGSDMTTEKIIKRIIAHR
ncbi:unnamed protein product [Cylicostephanus goldi]|uniref:ethanolamine-phosphate cytidylyltransferase n=1 Tax=Cylicostephanus goldi TaxID=71465 RepID=A0A3P6RGE5_CYLGO|nr:unnamed protein product [Cylicostephanus goldi]